MFIYALLLCDITERTFTEIYLQNVMIDTAKGLIICALHIQFSMLLNNAAKQVFLMFLFGILLKYSITSLSVG